ncbi:MAG: hypothetical protein ACK5B9_06145 [Flavobacteriia bacterium]|jgi:hypothetical protein
MLTFQEKISYLENRLHLPDGNYYDNFKDDLLIFFEDFNINNKRLNFLHHYDSISEIDNWIEKLSSRLVLKFDEEQEQLTDFIQDFIELG